MEAVDYILKATEYSAEHWEKNEANFPGDDPDIDLKEWWRQNCESFSCALCNLFDWKELRHHNVSKKFNATTKDCPLYRAKGGCCCPEWMEAQRKMLAGKLTKADITKVKKRIQREVSKLREQQ